MGIYTVNASIKPKFSWATFKKDRNFFSVLSYIYAFLQILKPFSITRLVIYDFIHCYHQLHSSDSPNCIYNWHVPRKWMGRTITGITFPYFLVNKENYNLLDYFRIFWNFIKNKGKVTLGTFLNFVYGSSNVGTKKVHGYLISFDHLNKLKYRLP